MFMDTIEEAMKWDVYVGMQGGLLGWECWALRGYAKSERQFDDMSVVLWARGGRPKRTF